MFNTQGHYGIKLVSFDEIHPEIIDFTQFVLENTFRKKVVRGESIALPIDAFDLEAEHYRSADLLSHLSSIRTHKEKIFGLINEDIARPQLPFVFGDGSPSKEAAVVSLWRFSQNFHYFEQDPGVFENRLKKAIIQEMSHAYGLRHCSNPQCVMFFPRSINDLDNQKDSYCHRCQTWF
ncbi:MAG: hypothetical protein ACLFQV_08160 [Vulcanimicrobiota bacterium]